MFNNIGPMGLILIAIVVLVLFGRGKVEGDPGIGLFGDAGGIAQGCLQKIGDAFVGEVTAVAGGLGWLAGHAAPVVGGGAGSLCEIP